MDILKQTFHGPMKRRLIHEYEELLMKYDIIFVSESNKTKYLINIDIMDKKNNTLSFHYGENYPFVSPLVLYNGAPIECSFLLPSQRFHETYYKLYKETCFCHNLFTRPCNWSPSLTTSKLINVFSEMQNKQFNIMYKIFADKIKQKYLVNDIDLDSWLF